MTVTENGITLDPNDEIDASTESVIKRFNERGVELRVGEDVTIDLRTLVWVYHNVFFDGVKFGKEHPDLKEKSK